MNTTPAPASSPDATRPVPPPMRLSGLEPVSIGEGALFVNIGDRIKVDTRERRYISRV